MQSAQDCLCDNVPEALDRASIWSDRNMRTPPIIIGGEFRKNPPKVLLIEHDQMFGTLARIDPIRRSTCPFCQGERNDVGRSRMPFA
jgi:hypothetical protein